MTPHLDNSSLSQRAQVWGRYWAHGMQHSCMGSFADNYDGRIGAFWQSVFDEIKPQAQVLEVCSGNAPLSRLLLTGSKTGTHVAGLVALDAAPIHPPWLAQADKSLLSRVTVLGETDVAAMPFAEGSFDLCMSQYGIEYIGAAAFAECGRVLRSGGRLAAALHHAEALQVRIGREECEHIAFLLGDSGLFRQADAMIGPLSRSATEQGRAELMRDARANATRAAFNECLRQIQARIDATTFPDVLIEQRDAVMQLLSRVAQQGAEVSRQVLDQQRQAVEDALVRQKELIGFAMDEATLREYLQSFPGEIERLETLCFDNGELAGWALVAVRH